jgi:hypothetical protein
MWKTKFPLKISIFIWQVAYDKIQSAEQLKKRNWPGVIKCILCGQIETTNHILLCCAVAQFCWCICMDVFEWPACPLCFDGFVDIIREGTNRQCFVSLFACLT